MHFDGLIFDLDGTLWNTTQSCVKGWNQALESLGHPRSIADNDVMRIMGMPHDEIYATLFPHFSPEQRKVIGKACFLKELEIIERDGGVLYPGVREGLEKLSKRFPLYLVSNCGSAYLETFWGSAQLKIRFRDWECHGNTGKGKTENLADVIRRNEMAHAAYFGDTAGDQKAALGAGATYYHMDYGFGEPLAPCHRFAQFSQLDDFFL